jgi:hypothetical protein
MKIGIIREEKTPPDRRVVLLPAQCQEIISKYPDIQFFIQPSPHRVVADEAYQQAGFSVTEDVSECDVLLGIKEVPVSKLLANKTYFFFSHTVKKQKHNRKLLQAVLEKNITLLDFECLTDSSGNRIIAFGRYAGIVGAYNALWVYGKKYGLYDLKRAWQCLNRAEMEQEYAKINLPPIKIVQIGNGRVGKGAVEVWQGIGIRQVSTAEFLTETFTEPVFTLLRSQDYHRHKEGLPWNGEDFHQNPQQYESIFKNFTQVADVLIATAYWNPKAPALFTRHDIQDENFRIRVVADITCDLDGSIPCTVRSTSIADPVFDFNREFGTIESPFSALDTISVMAIDNLPCELPLDASGFFGRQFIDNVLPHLLLPTPASNALLEKATVTRHGKLTPAYQYLQEFVNEHS